MSLRRRFLAREHALQRLYQLEITSQCELIAESSLDDALMAYSQSLVDYVCEHRKAIDDQIKPALKRTIADLDPVTHNVLRLGVCELLSKPSVDCKVIIDEAILLSRKFGSEQSFTIVNAVLHRLSLVMRQSEGKVDG